MRAASNPDFTSESLIHDPIHGYMPFTARAPGEITEQDIIDHPWIQRMRQIHQLQTAWWVFPSAEHTRFQHVLGAMHIASLAIQKWYPSLVESCRNVPSLGYVESLLRMAALLHDVGHGPFGHFFDDHFLSQFGVTHEDIGAHIIQTDLSDLLRGIRRNPHGVLAPLEQLEPAQVAWLIRRPKSHSSDEDGHPDWLRRLRAMFCGIYTVDNMDFVLRDAYASGYNSRAFDLSRLIHYSYFSKSGLTIHARGLPALINFIEVRANLFRTIYFHRTVRALDLALEEIFPETMAHLFSGNPIEHLEEYLLLTEFSFLVDVQRWRFSQEPELQRLGQRWNEILCRKMLWRMASERVLYFHSGNSERTTIFSEPDIIERRLRDLLPASLRTIPLRLDVARHYHRPSTRLPAGGQNYLFDPSMGIPRELTDSELIRSLPLSCAIFRVYARSHDYDAQLNTALNLLLDGSGDSKTNM